MKPESQTLIGNIYCSLLKRMQLSCTACLQSHNTQDDSRATTCRCCHKHEFLSLHGLSIGSHLLGISFITNLRSNLRTALTTQNTTENNSIISHAQKKKKTALQPNVFLNALRRLLVTNRGGATLPNARKTAKVHWKLLIQYQYVVCLLYDNKLFLNQYARGLSSLFP